MPVEIRQPQLQTYEYAPYFWTDGTHGVTFTAPANGATTSGSSNPRSELREMVKGGGPRNCVELGGWHPHDGDTTSDH